MSDSLLSRRNRRVVLAVPAVMLLLCSTVPSPAAPPGVGLLERGRFGFALRPRILTQTRQTRTEYKRPPLTVELWARLDDAHGFNILVANELKDSATHWEIYTEAGTGRLSALLTGYTPHIVHAPSVLTDGRWHFVAMTFDGRTITLFADGAQVLRKRLNRNDRRETVAGPLTFGNVVARDHTIGCHGLIDEVRLSAVLRPLDGLPKKPFEPDPHTIGLWHFDKLIAGSQVADQSKLNNAAVIPPVFETLDQRDAYLFQAGPAPWQSAAREVPLQAGPVPIPANAPVMKLDGAWQMVGGGTPDERLAAPWPHAIPCQVPGSVHTALLRAGRIPNPYTRKNEATARRQSYKTWWFRRTFPRPPGTGRAVLHFGGVAIDCTVWLNGKKLGSHKGMFGGPDFDVTDRLADRNSLVVRIDPVPNLPGPGPLNPFFTPNMNVGWTQTVVFNNVWGWHYCFIPAQGIWQSVAIARRPAVVMRAPFVSTRDAKRGVVDLTADMVGPKSGWSGRLTGCIRPVNFPGRPRHFHVDLVSNRDRKKLHLRTVVPNPQLWWPVDLGRPNLYRVDLALTPRKPATGPDVHSVTFGIRTIEMAPAGGGARPDRYNWKFVINGRPSFIKGAGWCTMDPLMDFSRRRYDRLLRLARDQHVQMLRAWGSGMPETDTFYGLCDRYGIMVLQEWPTAWNSHKFQPYATLEETVRRNTLRLRNHPSLAMWGGGNESDQPFGRAIDMMGRYARELDGTRPFHRGEPWGGSRHDYTSDWGRKHIDHNLNFKATFIGEFGMNSEPDYESVLRYLPKDEAKVWPPTPTGTFALHTPVFNTKGGLERLQQFSAYFVDGDNMKEFIFGTQMAQATVLRSTMELNRTRWPACTGVLYYKLNDNYPAASWATVDWYGAPKIGHYIMQDAMAPLLATIRLSSFRTFGKAIAAPVYVVDDTGALAGATWHVLVRAYDQKLHLIKRQRLASDQPVNRVLSPGTFTLNAQQTATSPLLLVVDLIKDGALAHRNYYWSQFEKETDSLLKLPRTTLDLQIDSGRVIVTNKGSVAAVGAHVSRPGHLDTFTASDNYFWLDPGQAKTITVSDTRGVTVSAWNAR